MLGCGTWSVLIKERGGGTLVDAPVDPISSGLSFERVLNGWSTASLTLPCLDTEIIPWQHEVHLLRDESTEWIGVPSFPTLTQDLMALDARDLGTWLDHRLLEREMVFKTQDIALIFRAIVEEAMLRDPSPGLVVDVEDIGVKATRGMRTQDRRVAGEEIRGLVDSGLDYTVHLRRIIGQSADSTVAFASPLLDEHFDNRQSSRSGLQTTEAIVLGVNTEVEGIAGGVDEHLGLVQTVVTSQSRILDDAGAAEAAQAFLAEPDLEVSGVLTQEAPYSFSELIPGVLMDARITTGPSSINQMLRLTKLRVTVGPDGERIEPTLVGV